MAVSKKAVAKTEDKAMALYEDVTNTGFDGTTADDYAIPFIKVLQKGSPEVDPDDGAYIDKAKVGMFVNTATAEVFDTIDVIPCHYSRKMVEWHDRDDGGGFVAQHEPGFEAGLDRDDKGRYVTDRGTYIADTRYFFSLHVRGDGGTEPVVLSFASTQLKKSRNWMTQMLNLKATGNDGRLFTLPMFANVYRLSTIPEENAKGSWRGYKIDRERFIDPAKDAGLLHAAIEASDLFRKVGDRVKPPADNAPGGGSSSTVVEDDIPF